MIHFDHYALPLLLVCIAVAVFRPALALDRRARLAALILIGVGLLFVPQLVPGEQRLGRALMAIVCGTLAFKFYDLHLSREHHRPPPPWLRYLIFLFSPFSMVERRLDQERIPDLRANLGSAARGFAILLLSVAPWFLADLDRLGQTSFLLEHAVKAVLVFAMLYAIAQLLAAVWFSLKLPGRAWMHFFFAARTPAEFWRLYNRPPGQFFYEDFFLRLGGLRFPGRAILICFAINGLLHEYISITAIGAVQGYQLSFFLVQGLAVALTQRLRPRGPWAAPGIVLTLAFNILSSLLFCASANQILPWYSDAAPAWMKPR